MRENGTLLIQLHTKKSAGKLLNYGSGNFNTIFFAHSPLNLVCGHVTALWHLSTMGNYIAERRLSALPGY